MTNSEKIKKLSDEVLRFAINTIIVNMRFLDAAVSRLKPNISQDITFGSDGRRLVYKPEYLLKRYVQSSNLTVHDYLHTLMHCIFRHNFVDPIVEHKLWDLSCDIAVENIINSFDIRSVEIDDREEIRTAINKLSIKVPVMTAEKLYHFFKNEPLDKQQFNKLSDMFCHDDHSLWYMTENEKQIYDTNNANNGEDNKQNNAEDQGDNKDNDKNNGEYNNISANDVNTQPELGSEEDWKNISEHIKVDMETMSESQGNKAGTLLHSLTALNRERYDYKEFLKKFAVMNEAMQINDDEFDYIFYTYGLDLYKNMPLIEPLEYKDVKQIREFVIAIDTSGSVSGELVQTFLQKTYNIMQETESFFSRINLHIIQCDAEIQEHIKITSRDEFNNYIKNMKIKGLGGTDFRPVFKLVDDLMHKKEFTNLKGMIYFTDGEGIYPSKKPSYETAFVFINDEYSDFETPSWAIKLVLEKEDIYEN